MATPETSKTTPCRSGSISKTLLTPCRRLGLARKLKTTPTNLSPQTPATKANVKVSSLSRSTSKNSSNTSSQVKKPTVIDSEHGNKHNETVSNTDNANEKSVDNVQVVSEVVKSQKVQQEPRIVKRKSERTTKSPTVELKPDLPCDLEEHTDIKELLDSKCPPVKTKLVKRLSMKKTPTHSQDELSDIEDTLNGSEIRSSSSLLSEQLTDFLGFEQFKPSLNKLNKKRRVLYSSDEEDFVSQQKTVKLEKEFGNSETEKWDTKISETKERIKIKKAHLTDMKQAVIYKKLHNLEELQELTTIWKKGCQDSLQHLLVKLQEHGPMDMYTLARNLKIPSFVTCNIDDTFT